MAFNLFPQTDFRQMDLNYVLEVSKQAAANLEEYAADKEQVVATQAAAEQALAAAQEDIQTATQAATSASQDAQTATQAAGTATQAAESAEQDAQTASEAAERAEQVQESIPADYTELSNQVSELKSDLSITSIMVNKGFTKVHISGATNNRYWNVENSVAVLTEISLGFATRNGSGYINVKEGELYEITAAQGQTHKTRIWVITDDNFNILAMANDYYDTPYIKHTEIVSIPSGGTRLLLTYANHSYVPLPRAVWDKLTISYPIDNGLLSDLGITNLLQCNKYGYYRSGTAYIASIEDMPVEYDGTAFMLFCDTPAFASAAFCLQTIESLSGNKWFRIIQNASTEWTVYQDWVRLPGVMDLKTNQLKGKKLSLLGDSISALAGTIPEGNAPYYSGSNHGIRNANQMWWAVLCAETEMTPCVINGWSGSGINWQTDANHADIVPMSDNSRCNALHNGDETPDVILIAGGVNDYSYAQYPQNEPLEWDGKSAPTYTEPTAGKQVYSSFTDAYAATIKKLQTNYPNAIIVALSTWFTMRGTDNGYTLTHTVGSNTYTQQDYNDKIRFVAEQMHIPYIDVSNIGFNRNNFYPTYASDSSTIPTHPNATGHAVMGKAIAAKLVDMIKGFM